MYLPSEKLLKQFDDALNLPEDVDKMFQENIKPGQFRRAYLGQFF